MASASSGTPSQDLAQVRAELGSRIEGLDRRMEEDARTRQLHTRYQLVIAGILLALLGYTSVSAIPNEVERQLATSVPAAVEEKLGKEVVDEIQRILKEAKRAHLALDELLIQLDNKTPWRAEIRTAIRKYGLAQLGYRFNNHSGAHWTWDNGGVVNIGEPDLGATHDNELRYVRPSQEELAQLFGQ